MQAWTVEQSAKGQRSRFLKKQRKFALSLNKNDCIPKTIPSLVTVQILESIFAY